MEIDKLREVVDEKLDTDNPHVLAKQLAERATWQAQVSYNHRMAEAELDKLKDRAWGNGKTDQEKKIRMEGLVADKQANADYLKDLADILRGQISLGQSLIKSMEAELRLSK